MKIIWLNFSQDFLLITDSHIIKQGTLKEVVQAAVNNGIRMRDIEDAITEMENKRDNVAEFGIWKSFMFTTYDQLYDISSKLKQS